jgi:hypothetical protein
MIVVNFGWLFLALESLSGERQLVFVRISNDLSFLNSRVNPLTGGETYRLRLPSMKPTSCTFGESSFQPFITGRNNCYK